MNAAITNSVEVTGCALGPFAEMTQIFARAVGAQNGGGAQLAVFHRGKKVVDLAGGDLLENSVMLVFSVSKAIVSVAVHHAISAGLLEPDLLLHKVWPAFERSARTRAITLDHVLTHSSGLPSVERVLTLNDHLSGELIKELETQEPYWIPGSAHGYHAFTFGTLLGAVFDRGLGQSLPEYIRQNLSVPLGLDLSLGATEEQLTRVRPYRRPVIAETPLDRNAGKLPDALPDGAGAEIWADMMVFNREDVLRSTWPATNIVSSARDLAKVFSATMTEVGGTRLLDEEALRRMTESRFRGEDRMLRFPIAFGSGVQLPFPQFAMLGPGSFGHEGAGGSILVGDPARELAVAYISDSYPASNGAAQPAYALLSALALIVDQFSD